MKKKIILGVAILTLMSGCGKTIPTLENGQNAVVTFEDGSKISVDELYNELKKSYATSLIIDMIDKKILEDQYKDEIEASKTYATNYIDSLKNYSKDENGKYNEQELLASIKQYYGYNSLEEFQESVRINFLRNKAIDDYAAGLISDKDIEKYYEDEIVGDREVLHIQIIPDVKDSMTDEEKKSKEEEAENKAKAIIASLKKGEKSFEDLAKENSQDDSTKESGGSLGFINKGDYGSDEFDKEVYNLKVGEFSTTPVKTTNGYEIVFVKSENEKASLDSKKDEIKKTLADKKLTEDATLQVTAISEFRKSKGVNIIDSEVNKDYNRYVDKLLEQARQSNLNSSK